MAGEKVEVLNINQPGHAGRVDAAKYRTMRSAMIEVVPATAPGMTAKEIIAAVKPHLPGYLFPAGETAGWWVKCVQLDLEARGIMQRSAGSPLRFWKTGEGE